MGVMTGYVMGTGAAINVECGFVPDHVEVMNVTDGDKITRWNRGRLFTFTSGGTQEIKKNTTLIGASSGAKMVVRQVMLSSGSWAGGDAAGVFICDETDVTGTITDTENVFSEGGTGTNDATLTTALGGIQMCHSVDTEVANETGNSAISAYVGSGQTYARGFTIGSTVSEEAKVLRWTAIQSDGFPGE